jgi:hypothetical protein
MAMIISPKNHPMVTMAMDGNKTEIRILSKSMLIPGHLFDKLRTMNKNRAIFEN